LNTRQVFMIAAPAQLASTWPPTGPGGQWWMKNLMIAPRRLDDVHVWQYLPVMSKEAPSAQAHPRFTGWAGS
jgi:hypothetical protein